MCSSEVEGMHEGVSASEVKGASDVEGMRK